MAAKASINQSLLVQPLFFHVPIEALVGELLFLLLLFTVFGFSFVTLLFGALILGVCHPLLAAATRREPQAIALFLDALRYPAHLPARGTLAPYRSVRPRPAI